MEVSQIAGLDTHAVIGGDRAQAFEISQSAEFFTVLSATLYRDKKRAVVREVVCNAWDSHIVTGQTSRPIEITITDTELTIRDFGPGIPHDKIGPIYCRYGSSTKIADENQTGGFGLGSKAPFAYSDHFSVTSCHEGTRSVYAISRGGAETDGKPDFRRMVAVPTDESGLTVTIPLREDKDKEEFLKIANTVVRQGGMKALINGDLLEGYDWEPARAQGFALLNDATLRESQIYVLYGTVLYPLTTTDGDIIEMGNALHNAVNGAGKVVLIAPPNSIGVTPSRESLSYTDKTKETLLRIGKRATARILHEQRKHAGKVFAKAVKRQEIEWWQAPRTDLDRLHIAGLVTELDRIGKICATWHINRFIPNTRKAARLALATKHRDQRRVLRRAAFSKKVSYSWHGMPAVDYFRYSMRLHMRLAAQAGVLSRIYAAQPSYAKSERIYLTRIDKNGFRDDCGVAPEIFIAFNQRDALKGMTAFRDAHLAADPERTVKPALVAIVLKRGERSKIAEIKRLAARYKFNVTEMNISEPPKRAKPILEEEVFRDFKNINDYGDSGSKESLRNPTYYVRAESTRRSGGYRVPAAYYRRKDEILKHYSGIAIAMDGKDEAKLRMMGVKPLHDAMIEDVKRLGLKRGNLFAYGAAAHQFLDEYASSYDSPVRLIARAAATDLRLASHFLGVKVKVTPEVERFRLIATVLKEIPRDLYYAHHRKITDPIKTVLDELTKRMKSEFRELPNQKELNSKYAYLTPIAGGDRILQEPDLFLEMCNFLKRRHERLGKKRETENATETRKEAA